MEHEAEFRLWPLGASDEYIAARRKLLDLERALRDSLEEVASARRALPSGTALGTYRFAEGPRALAQDEPVCHPTLREVFGDYDTLFVYHLMFAPTDTEACSMCSMWVDGFHGVSPHLAQHTAFAVIAKAPLPQLRAWGRRRGWEGLRLLSSYDNTFNPDMGVEEPDGSQRPAVSVFVKDGEQVRHFYTMQADFSREGPERGIDLLSPVWHVLDLLPQGRGQWYAENTYAGATRG
jgi:predicted dithiol-disulfide oxidoreductase (DUF899 family)